MTMLNEWEKASLRPTEWARGEYCLGGNDHENARRIAGLSAFLVRAAIEIDQLKSQIAIYVARENRIYTALEHSEGA